MRRLNRKFKYIGLPERGKIYKKLNKKLNKIKKYTYKWPINYKNRKQYGNK